jgi:hypothetical protein
MEWEDIKWSLDEGNIQSSTLDLLINEVGSSKKGTLTFDQFWQLVTLLEDASEAASASNGDISDESEPSDAELEQMAQETFDELKSKKTGKVSVKAFKKWEGNRLTNPMVYASCFNDHNRAWIGVKEVLDSGDLSKSDLNRCLLAVGADQSADMDFQQFSRVMDLLEEAMDSAGESDLEGDEIVDTSAEILPSTKGFGKAPASSTQSSSKSAPQEGGKQAKVDNEADQLTLELFNDLRGNVSARGRKQSGIPYSVNL